MTPAMTVLIGIIILMMVTQSLIEFIPILSFYRKLSVGQTLYPGPTMQNPVMVIDIKDINNVTIKFVDGGKYTTTTKCLMELYRLEKL